MERNLEEDGVIRTKSLLLWNRSQKLLEKISNEKMPLETFRGKKSLKAVIKIIVKRVRSYVIYFWAI